jgi:hypothetical protein
LQLSSSTSLSAKNRLSILHQSLGSS